MSIEMTTLSDMRRRRGEISVATARSLRHLLHLVTPARREAAEAEVRDLEALLSELDAMAGRANPSSAESAGTCWRCGAGLGAVDHTIEQEIELNLENAAWSGWNADAFRLKARSVLEPGDRIIKVDIGAFIYRKPDGTAHVVRLLDA
jgi:hypothetical protein